VLLQSLALGVGAALLLIVGVAQAEPLSPLPPPLGPGAQGQGAEDPDDDDPADEDPETDRPSAQAAPDEPAGSPVAAQPGPSAYAAEIITLTNDERAAAGCDPLDVDERLTAAAQLHAEDMADRQEMSHIGGDGSTFDERIHDQGHPKPGAENVARGYPDAATTVREWMVSPSHRRNIVNCRYVTIGAGFDPRGNFVAQEFGRPE